MKLLYHIPTIYPDVNKMGGCGFSVKLYPAWKELVAASDLSNDRIQEIVRCEAAGWLAGHGYDSSYDKSSIRIKSGEWGPEHITIPGNACGLDSPPT